MFAGFSILQKLEAISRKWNLTVVQQKSRNQHERTESPHLWFAASLEEPASGEQIIQNIFKASDIAKLKKTRQL